MQETNRWKVRSLKVNISVFSWSDGVHITCSIMSHIKYFSSNWRTSIANSIILYICITCTCKLEISRQNNKYSSWLFCLTHWTWPCNQEKIISEVYHVFRTVMSRSILNFSQILVNLKGKVWCADSHNLKAVVTRCWYYGSNRRKYLRLIFA